MNLVGIAGNIRGDEVTVHTSDDEVTGRAVNVDYGLEGLTLELEEETGKGYK